MSNNYYFFCLAYSNIPAILSIIEKKDISKLNICVVVTFESHKLFWLELIEDNNLKWKVIFLDIYPGGKMRNPLTWIRIRKLIMKLFKSNFQFVHNSNIYFFSSSFSLAIFALIKILSRTNIVYFLDCDKRISPIWYKLYKLKSIALLVLGYLFYKVDIKIVNVDDNPVPTLSNRFFKKLKIKRITDQEYPYDIEIISKYNFVNSNITADKCVVLLDDDCYSFSSFSGVEFQGILSKLKKLIELNYIKSEILFKRHPNPAFHKKEFSLIYSDYSECPYYVPADFIFLEPTIRCVIGGFSTTLGIAAKYYNVKAISYIKLVSFRSEGYKNRVIKILEAESDNKIVFPDSWEELNSLLKNVNIRGDIN